MATFTLGIMMAQLKSDNCYLVSQIKDLAYDFKLLIKDVDNRFDKIEERLMKLEQDKN